MFGIHRSLLLKGFSSPPFSCIDPGGVSIGMDRGPPVDCRGGIPGGGGINPLEFN